MGKPHLVKVAGLWMCGLRGRYSPREIRSPIAIGASAQEAFLLWQAASCANYVPIQAQAAWLQ